MQRRTFTAAVLSAAAAAAPLGVLAQGAQGAFPSKPVRFVVPYAPGGLPDTVARIVSQKLTERWGQSVLVDNKPGGNGVVSYQNLMSGANDNHTFIVSDGSMLSITPLINKQATYGIDKELMPVSLIARSPLFIVAHPSTGVKTFAEFIAKARENPGKYTYGSSGIGSTHHLTMEAIKADLKLDVRHVPFRGSGQSVPALVGGQVDFLVSALPSLLGFVRNKQVVVLASNGPRRSPQAPDVPTVSEFIPNFDFSVAVGVIGRSGTPAEIVRKIADDIAQVVRLPDVVEKFQTAGIEPAGLGPDAYRRDIERENAAMAKAGKHADLKAE